jgi:hypothetical protein
VGSTGSRRGLNSRRVSSCTRTQRGARSIRCRDDDSGIAHTAGGFQCHNRTSVHTHTQVVDARPASDLYYGRRLGMDLAFERRRSIVRNSRSDPIIPRMSRQALRWSCRSFLIRLALPAIAVSAIAARPAFADWKRIDSPNFVVIGDVSAGQLRDVAVRFEGFRETLSRVLSQRATATAVPTVVIVFPSDKALTPFKPRFKGKPVELSGLFVPRSDIN